MRCREESEASSMIHRGALSGRVTGLVPSVTSPRKTPHFQWPRADPGRDSSHSPGENGPDFVEILGTGATAPIKRCVIEPRNFLVVSPRRGQSRGPSQALAALGPISVPGHTGVGGTWRMILRVSRELGRPCRLHRDCRLEPRLTNSRLIHGSRPEPMGTNRGRTDGITKRRKRSAATRAARSRSAP